MSLETKSTDIGGVAYQVTQLPAMRGLKLLNRLGRALGPALADLLGGAESLSSIAQMDLGALGVSVRALFDRLTEDELQFFTATLLENARVTINGQVGPLMPVFDLHFAGQYENLFRLLWFALETNYGNFSGGLVGRLVALRGQASPIEASTISPPPGQPGASSSPAR